MSAAVGHEVLAALGLAQARRVLGLSGARSATWFVATPDGGGRPDVVVRIHRGAGPDRVAHEHAFLLELRERAPTGFAASLPVPLARARVGGLEVASLSVVPGRPLGGLADERRLVAALGGVRLWLTELAAIVPAPARERPPARTGLLAALAARPAWAAAGAGACRSRLEALTDAVAPLDDLGPVYGHFDLGPGNVLVRPAGGGVAVVDWEYGRLLGVGYDWCRFLVQAALARRGAIDLRGPVAPERVLAPLDALCFARTRLAARVRDETLALLALQGVPLVLAGACLRLALLEYLTVQIPFTDPDAVVAHILAAPSLLDDVR